MTPEQYSRKLVLGFIAEWKTSAPADRRGMARNVLAMPLGVERRAGLLALMEIERMGER